MVILLCSTPRRGMVALATHDMSSGFPGPNSKKLGCSQSTRTRIQEISKSPTSLRNALNDFADLVDNDDYNDGYNEPHSSPPCSASFEDTEPDLSSACDNRRSTEFFDQNCCPVSINCKFSKKFFGVPKKCGDCQKLIIGTGFACQYCSYRSHKKCIMIDSGAEVSLRSKHCSLSRLPPGDDPIMSKLFKGHEIDSNFIDYLFNDDNDNDSGYMTNSMHSKASSVATHDDIPSTVPSTPSMLSTASQPTSPAESLTTCASRYSYSQQPSYQPASNSALQECSRDIVPDNPPLHPVNEAFTEHLHAENSKKKVSKGFQSKFRWMHPASCKSGTAKRSAFSPLFAKLRLRNAIAKPESAPANEFIQEVDVGSRMTQVENEVVAQVREPLANTWPLSGQRITYDGCDRTLTDDDLDDCEVFSTENEAITNDQSNGFEELSDDCSRRQSRLSDLGEWTIPYTDLEFGECVRECRNVSTYKGRWHGDVMIYTYMLNGADNVHTFLEDVRTLTKIRHENVALFMGASIEAPLLAVVTTIRNGNSLYNAVHLENVCIPDSTKLNIARQVAQGMSYLHAKGVVLKTLSSKSIYLESKVKISTVDESAPLKRHDRPQMGCLRRGHLTYISPELMQTLQVSPPALVTRGTSSEQSDVYAFGTVLYEMFAGDFPFAQAEPDVIIWAIGTGKRQDVENVPCNGAMKSMIKNCWSSEPKNRPPFVDVLQALQHMTALPKKNSSSVPEQLNMTGRNQAHYNYGSKPMQFVTI